MLGLSMMIGDGRPTFRVEINANTNQWEIVNDAPQLLVSYPIILHLVVGPGVTVASTSSIDAGVSLFGLPNYSDVYLTNRGNIYGKDGATVKASTGFGIYGNWNGGNLYLDNQGWIYAGTLSDGLGYAVYMAGSPVSTLRWVSGASRITGSVYP